MAVQAKVTSTEALESFRAALIVFLDKAKRSLDDSSDAVKRTRQWLQHDQRVHLEGELRRRAKVLERAQQELMTARLGTPQQSALMARQAAVAKAQREVVEMEGKLRKLKSWNQNYDSVADPILKRMDRLGQSIIELPKAIAYLTSVQKTLEAYAESAGPSSAPSTAPSSESETASTPETQPAAGGQS